MSFLTIAQARAAGLGLELSDTDLQDAIDEEEAWLAGKIGPLVGERTQLLPLAYLAPRSSEIRLKRPTDAVEVEQDGVALAEVAVRPDGWHLAALPEGTRYRGVLAITYTPTDELQVRRALKQLLGLTLSAQQAGGLTGETIGTYSYQRSAGTSARVRKAIVRDLLTPPAAGTTRVRSTVPHGLAGLLER